MDDPLPDGRPPYREPPAFNVPGPVLALLLLVVGIHLVMSALDWAMREQVILWFALFPIRYTEGASAIADALPGGLAPSV